MICAICKVTIDTTREAYVGNGALAEFRHAVCERAAPPVDTEAAEVWRKLSMWHRMVLCDGAPLMTDTAARLEALGLIGADNICTDLGKRVAAYGRAQAEVTRG